MAEPATRRRYASPTRQRAAENTRMTISTAAARLFASEGYAATTIRAIAESAGVAVQTVYAVFGSKRGILLDLVARAKEEARIGPAFEALMAEPDPYRQIAATVEITARWARAAVMLVDLVRSEAGSDPDVAAAWEVIEESRLRGNRALVARLAERGLLRADLDVGRATDLLWTLESTDLYRHLVVERRWRPAAYRSHLTAILTATLLK